MKGTPFAQFSTEVLRRGAAAVLPQHLPDRWLDALLEEADPEFQRSLKKGPREIKRRRYLTHTELKLALANKNLR